MSIKKPGADPAATRDLFSGTGSMAALMREHDWSRSALGNVGGWPQSLCSAISIMLNSRYPIALYWGPDRTLVYNDDWAPILGNKHPWALGRPAHEVWPEIWEEIDPLFVRVFGTGEGTWSEDQLLAMNRHGYVEECYFNFTFSPIRGTGGRVDGIFNAVVETTDRVLNERRLRTLNDLGAYGRNIRDSVEACRQAAAILGTNQADIPFCLVYLADDAGQSAVLTASSNIRQGHPAAPASISLLENPTAAVWPLNAEGSPQMVELPGIAERIGSLPHGMWPEQTTDAVILPIVPPGQSLPAGFLIAGVNPRHRLDYQYRSFFNVISGHVATAIAHARAYEQERERAEALAEIDKAKTLFFSNVSHELRTPLTLILGPLEKALAGAAGDGGSRKELELAHRNGLRLLKLVNTLLDFSRVEAGRIRAAFHPVELAGLTADLSSNFRSACERAGLSLIIDCPPLDAPVYVDRDMWEKIIFNLLSNAFKFTFEGSISVSLRGRGSRAELAVTDTGTGIPADELPYVFERFHRVENARGRTHEGTGIGLALVSELVKLHGGTVDVESLIGQGTTFTIGLPMGSAHLPREQIGGPLRTSTSTRAEAFLEEAMRWLPEDDSAGTAPHAGGAAPRGTNRPDILLADDNPDMREYIQRVLAERYEVVAVADGEAALDAAGRRRPELIISDVMMPRLDGFGLLRAVRGDPGLRNVPFVMLSARAEGEAEIEGLEAGADDYLIKPFSARELMARVDSLLSRSRLQRETEEHFRILADNSPVILWTSDPDARCTYLSRQWYEYTGGTPQTDLGQGWLEKVHPDDRERCRDAFLDANARHAPFNIDYRLRGRDGAYRWAVDTGMPRFDPDGRFQGYVGCVFDVHDRKLAEEALQERELTLRDADRRKDEFLATLAHELRNPLAPISNALHIMRLSGTADGKIQELLERQLQQLVRLVDDLMEVSRITRGKIDLKREIIRLADVIHNAVETVEPLIRERGQKLTVKMPEDGPWLEADLSRLSQVFANILHNAAKYTQAGGAIALTVTAAGGEAVVTVEDNGAGIPPDKLPEIFEMFSQADNSLDRAQGGLGIGLTLVRQLVGLHGGRVEADSEGPGKGSRFTIYLPVSGTSGAGPKPGARAIPAPSGKALRVLVVDDNQESARTLARMVELLGHEVHCAFSGPAALAKAGNFVPDVVLLDIGMPDMDGYEVCREMKRQAALSNTVFVAQTGWDEKRHHARSRETGFHHHLVKPVDFDSLQDLLSKAAS